jgi:hypothetical protein
MPGRARFARPLHTASLLAAALWFAPSPALACSCVVAPLCQQSWGSDRSFFAATVVAIERESAVSPPPGVIGGERYRVHLADVSALRGMPASVVVTATHPDACGYAFSVGARYLIDAASGEDGVFVTSRCALTRPAENAGEIHDYLARLAGPSPGASVDGVVRLIISAPADRGPFAEDTVRGLAGVRVALTGQRTATTMTDAQGRFTFSDLPPGDYAIALDPATHPGLRVRPGSRDKDSFGLESDHSCHSSFFALEPG